MSRASSSGEWSNSPCVRFHSFACVCDPRSLDLSSMWREITRVSASKLTSRNLSQTRRMHSFTRWYLGVMSASPGTLGIPPRGTGCRGLNYVSNGMPARNSGICGTAMKSGRRRDSSVKLRLTVRAASAHIGAISFGGARPAILLMAGSLVGTLKSYFALANVSFKCHLSRP